VYTADAVPVSAVDAVGPELIVAAEPVLAVNAYEAGVFAVVGRASKVIAAAVEAAGLSGEVAAFVDGGNTYLWGEGASTLDTDNTAAVLVGQTITKISINAADAGAGVLIIA